MIDDEENDVPSIFEKNLADRFHKLNSIGVSQITPWLTGIYYVLL